MHPDILMFMGNQTSTEAHGINIGTGDRQLMSVRQDESAVVELAILDRGSDEQAMQKSAITEPEARYGCFREAYSLERSILDAGLFRVVRRLQYTRHVGYELYMAGDLEKLVKLFR